MHDAKEAELVEKKGGFAKDGRVNGVLTVSRSLGDKFLAHILSCEPHVHTSKFPMQGALVLASDGKCSPSHRSSGGVSPVPIHVQAYGMC